MNQKHTYTPCVSERAEEAYWNFDARRKGYGPWRLHPQSERDAFKSEYCLARKEHNNLVIILQKLQDMFARNETMEGLVKELIADGGKFGLEIHAALVKAEGYLQPELPLKNELRGLKKIYRRILCWFFDHDFETVDLDIRQCPLCEKVENT
jgi:hypothetical protein